MKSFYVWIGLTLITGLPGCTQEPPSQVNIMSYQTTINGGITTLEINLITELREKPHKLLQGSLESIPRHYELIRHRTESATTLVKFIQNIWIAGQGETPIYLFLTILNYLNPIYQRRRITMHNYYHWQLISPRCTLVPT